MKITPALLLPQRMPAPQDLTAIAAAQAVDQATDPTGREAPPRVPVQTDPVQRAQRVQAVGVDRARALRHRCVPGARSPPMRM